MYDSWMVTTYVVNSKNMIVLNTRNFTLEIVSVLGTNDGLKEETNNL